MFCYTNQWDAELHYLLHQSALLFCYASCTIFCTHQHRCSVTPSNQMPSCTIFCTNQHCCTITPINEMPSCYILHQSVAELLYFAPISTVVLLRQPMRCRIAIFCTNKMPFSLLTGRLLFRNRSTPRRRASCGSPSGMNYFYSSGHYGLSSSCLLYSKIIRIITYYHHVQ